MDRLNYFNPYDSKNYTHEDQLTRAYLVLLRMSHQSFNSFLDYISDTHKIDDNISERPFVFNKIPYDECFWGTQKGNPIIRTEWLLSLLITDEVFETMTSTVESADRIARYDGVITLGKELTIIIENKPRNFNIWDGQLNPTMHNLSEETKIYRNPARLEWKVIIKELNKAITSSTIERTEKILIEDFLAFIAENFPYLNPYDKFHLCKGNTELLQRRIQNVLKSIVTSEEYVQYHLGWGFYLSTPYKEIKEIGLILNQINNDWLLELSFYYADTQSQAKAFYSRDPKISHLTDGWYCVNNFHVAYRSSNLVWFNEMRDHEIYMNFWKENVDNIYQQKRNEVDSYLSWLADEEIISISSTNRRLLNEKFYETAMQNLNICPGFGAIYEISSSEAQELDMQGKLEDFLIEQIREGLQIVHRSGEEFLKLNRETIADTLP